MAVTVKEAGRRVGDLLPRVATTGRRRQLARLHQPSATGSPEKTKSSISGAAGTALPVNFGVTGGRQRGTKNSINLAATEVAEAFLVADRRHRGRNGCRRLVVNLKRPAATEAVPTSR